MTSVRDFQPIDRTGTTNSIQSDPAAPTHRRGTGASRRRSSVVSRTTSIDSAAFKKHIARSNTVKTYRIPDRPNWQPGAEPGLDTTKEEAEDEPRLIALRANCDIRITDYSEDLITTQKATNTTLKEALSEPRPDDMPCRWISVNGLSWDVIKILANKYKLHRLAVEDLTNTRSRTKVDWYSDHAFIILTLQKLVRICTHQESGECDCEESDSDDENVKISHGIAEEQDNKSSKPWWMKLLRSGSEDNVLPQYEYTTPPDTVKVHNSTSTDSPVKNIRTLHRYEGSHSPEYTAFMEKHSVLAEENMVVAVEQVAIFLMADNTVISFFEHSGPDVEGPIMERLNSLETMLRRSNDASLLVEAIIDTIVDLALPIRDAYNKARKEMQIDVLTNPDISTSKSLYIFSEEVDMLQNLFKPIVHLVNALRDHQTEPLHQQNLVVNMARRQDPLQENVVPDVGGDSEHSVLHRNHPAMTSRRPMYRAQTSTSVVISPLAHTYLGDVLDHCITHIQSLEQMDASATNLSSLIFNTVGAHTNNFMMILALVTVFFSPLTFISGYFGMNFERFTGVQEHSDAFFWIVALPSVFVFMAAVSGNVIWTSAKTWFVKLTIKKVRSERNKRRAAGFGVVNGSAKKSGKMNGMARR
ncbi:hypothetical protein K461DRAFT_1415 [Myriangium duriaei CBS 260.36]|uniref:Magnesium and cobalt transporter CorA n=1 Tax=Myriangium duriaei CBS 260.36 TaxID=1168546 RepID=A0A9P4MJ20_9PEZI|nr:hypothetical protein K461DRAFT_1415 [Myriangium duriaei CBS 260.36]